MIEPVTGEQLATICRKEWGESWKTAAALHLGFARRTIYAWDRNPGRRIHKSAWEKVHDLAAKHNQLRKGEQ